MAPRKRRGVGCVKGSITLPPTATNTRGLAALPDEIYLEILSHIPSVPIPISIDASHLDSYQEIRRSRHKALQSLSQTSRSLRRFFWRYLWQYIEVREGIKIMNKDILRNNDTKTAYRKYAKELLRQLKVVTVRDSQLAQYVK
jgi:hypothetical protein